ncbi:MAG TPA: histidine kinase [Trebonia sp.]|jgi:signal transduction histidine kinase|nr:histidine kinase [Trebonia sp.]
MTLLIVLAFIATFVPVVARGLAPRWRLAPALGAGGPPIRVPQPRDIGWGAALVPVALAFLALAGTFAITNEGGTGSGNLFDSSTMAGNLFYAALVLGAAGFYALVQPRLAGYAAAAGTTALGLWVLFEALAFHHYAYDHEWFGWLRDQLYFPELIALSAALLAGGFVLTRRTIVADVRASRSGLTARVERLTQTRADAVDSAAAELRRLERDLHDGAQARLVALGINLRTAEKLIETSPAAATTLVAECRESATVALSELRALVRGIYPPVLADRGLADAVRALALSCPYPVVTDVGLGGRPPAPVESAVYFAVAEALSNVTKHARATSALVRLAHDGRMLRAEVHDDGSGGADPAGGTGLAGMERRLAAFDGILAVSSPVGGPTIVAIEVPCDLSSPKTSTC